MSNNPQFRGQINEKNQCIMCKEYFDKSVKMFVLEDKENKKFYFQCQYCATISDGRKILIIKK